VTRDPETEQALGIARRGEVVGIKTARGVIPADQPAPTVLTHGRAYGQSEMALVQNGGTPVTNDPETGADITLERYALGQLWQETPQGTSHPRRFNLSRPDPDRPLPTILQRGGDVSAASVAHWSECRKLTLGELRRLSGFPDDFVLTGTYAQRWERIGRAVPPVMMSQVAAVIRDQILDKIP
jgi:DNA (cytosine-5)-methyltransferase 1